jgi:hypothetical protein
MVVNSRGALCMKDAVVIYRDGFFRIRQADASWRTVGRRINVRTQLYHTNALEGSFQCPVCGNAQDERLDTYESRRKWRTRGKKGREYANIACERCECIAEVENAHRAKGKARPKLVEIAGAKPADYECKEFVMIGTPRDVELADRVADSIEFAVLASSKKADADARIAGEKLTVARINEEIAACTADSLLAEGQIHVWPKRENVFPFEQVLGEWACNNMVVNAISRAGCRVGRWLWKVANTNLAGGGKS